MTKKITKKEIDKLGEVLGFSGKTTTNKDGEVVGYVRRADYAFHMDYPICYG